jgi:hypothetical protein
MREWVEVPAEQADEWGTLAMAALEYVSQTSK